MKRSENPAAGLDDIVDDFDEDDFDFEFDDDFEAETDEEIRELEAVHEGDFSSPVEYGDAPWADDASSRRSVPPSGQPHNRKSQ